MIGTRLGPYEITARLGEGGMGEVFRATDPKLRREVAIKVLPEALAADPDRLARFEREAQLLAQLQHPNIASIYGIEESSGVRALVMELAPGEDLSERLKRGPLPVDEALGIARQIAEALEAAHEKGIVHRDLKPANVKLTPDGKVKVLDFGLAKAMDAPGATSAVDLERSPTMMNSPTMTAAGTRAGVILGTAAYMSPEQARGKPVDKRADIWAFGVVLHEMLTGRRLFAGETVSDVLAAVLTRDLGLADLPGSVPTRLRSLLHDCLVRDPRRRLRDVGDARIALDQILAGGAAGDTAPPEKRARRRAWWVPAALALLVAAGGIGLVAGRATVAPRGAPMFTQRTFVPQVIFNARFMPDGGTLIFSAALSGSSPSLYELRPDATAPRSFGPGRTHLLSISRSGELAVLTEADFIHQRLFRGTLSRMSAEGAPRAIASDVREADWLPDGSDLAVIRDTATGDELEFPVGNVVHRAPGYLSDPRVSPDGTRVAFLEHPIKFDDRGWVKVVDRSGKVTIVAGDFPAEEGVAWSRDGRSVWFGAFVDNQMVVLAAPARGGGPLTTVVGSAGSLTLHDVAPDGRVAVTRETFRYGVAARGAGQGAERDLAPHDQAWRSRLTRDGRFLFLTDGRGGHDYAVVRRGVDGSPPARLGDGNTETVSTDGRWVTATLYSTGRCAVYPTGTGAMVPVPMGPLETCQSATFFPDGKSLLLVGNEPGKPTRAYRAPFPGGTPEALLPAGLAPIRISASGRRLLVQDAGRAWHVVEIGGASTPLTGLLGTDVVVEWSDDERELIVTENGKAPAPIEKVRLDTGARTRLGEMGPADRVGLLEVDPTAYRDGGRQYAYDFSRSSSELYLVGVSR